MIQFKINEWLYFNKVIERKDINYYIICDNSISWANTDVALA